MTRLWCIASFISALLMGINGFHTENPELIDYIILSASFIIQHPKDLWKSGSSIVYMCCVNVFGESWCVPQLVVHMHRSSKTPPLTACVARGNTDAVILCLRNHGDSPFSSVLCLLASLSNGRIQTHIEHGEAGFWNRTVWQADSWQSKTSHRLFEVHFLALCLTLHEESFKRSPAECSV